MLKTGKIEIAGGGAIDCSIRNLSESGAALNVASPLGTPEIFTLIIPTDDFRRACRVVWRKEMRIGITFLA